MRPSGNQCCLNWLKGQVRSSVFYPWWPTKSFHQRRWKIYKHDLGWMIMNLILELVGLGYWPKEAKIGGKYKDIWASQVVFVVKNPCRRCKRCGFHPSVGKISWRRACKPTPVFLPGESLGRRAWQTTVHGVADNQTQLKQLRMHACIRIYKNKTQGRFRL